MKNFNPLRIEPGETVVLDKDKPFFKEQKVEVLYFSASMQLARVKVKETSEECFVRTSRLYKRLGLNHAPTHNVKFRRKKDRQNHLSHRAKKIFEKK